MTAEKMVVADEILRQLGGGRFVAMTGSRNFIGSDNSLSFKVGRNAHRIGYVSITLNAMDTYDMAFPGARGKVTEIGGVYNDQLQAVFTKATGLYTSL